MQKQSALLSKLAAVHRGGGRPALYTCRSYRSPVPPKHLLWGHAPFPAFQNGTVNAKYRGSLSSVILPTWPTPFKHRGVAAGASDHGRTKDIPAAASAQEDEEKQVRIAPMFFLRGSNADDPDASQHPSACGLASPVMERPRLLFWQALPEIILRPWQQGIENAGQPLAQTAARWQARIAAYARTSFLSGYAAFVDNTLVALLQALRLDDLFRKATPWLEDRLAALTGLPLCHRFFPTFCVDTC